MILLELSLLPLPMFNFVVPRVIHRMLVPHPSYAMSEAFCTLSRLNHGQKLATAAKQDDS